MPTQEQTLQAAILCHWLSNCLQPIYLFRYDLKKAEIFIIAGIDEEIEFVINREGKWRFTDDEA